MSFLLFFFFHAALPELSRISTYTFLLAPSSSSIPGNHHCRHVFPQNVSLCSKSRSRLRQNFGVFSQFSCLNEMFKEAFKVLLCVTYLIQESFYGHIRKSLWEQNGHLRFKRFFQAHGATNSNLIFFFFCSPAFLTASSVLSFYWKVSVL